MALRIRIEHGQDAGKTWRLGGPGTYRFGRNPGSSVQVLDMKVSKDHFEIAFGDGVDPRIRDLESSHGTLLNGQPVSLAGRPLVPGDEIRVGLTVLRVLSDGPADGEAPARGPAPAPEAAANGAASAPAAAPAGATPAAGDTTARRAAGSLAGTTSLTASGSISRPAGDTTARRGAPLPPDELVGRTLAGYRILEKVGAGGMGAVYRAEQLSLHREVALKVLAEKLVSDSAFVDQFVNEARAAGALNHPNVVQVYDVGEAEGRHFFSMEYIHGGSIENRIPRGTGVPWSDALSWFLDAANALVFAEKKGILHRDIKPDNFMISQDGSAKLCDLGLAKKSESDDLLSQGIIGTPHFISPEAIRRRTDVDRRSDLYSLGCTFYKVLTGKNPYPLGSVKEILLAHLNAPVPRVSALVSDVPKELDEIVFRLMQKEPADRFQDAGELWNALDKVRLQFGMAAHGLNPGRAKKVAILVTVAALAAIGVALKIALKPPEQTTVVVEKDAPKQDPEIARQNERQRIENSYLALDNEELRLGKDFSKEEAWNDMAAKWDDFAKKPETASSERSQDAARKAQAIRDELAKYRAALAKNAQDVAECCSLVNGRYDQAKAQAEDLRKQGNLVEAERVLGEAVRSIGKQLERNLYDPVKGKKLVDELRGMVDPLVTDLAEAWNATKAEADKAHTEGADGLEGLEKEKAVWRKWLDGRPVPDAAARSTSPRTSTKLAEFAEAAKSRVDFLEKTWTETRVRQLQKDNRGYFDVVRKTYAGRPEDGQGVRGGWIAEFEASAAKEAFLAAARDAKTPEFRELDARRAAEAEKLERLPGRLARAFAEKPWKDAIAWNGWKGSITEVRADSVKVQNQDRFFRVEGLAFFVDLFFDAKGQERFALTADDHEGLAIAAEAAGIAFDGPSAEGAKLFERAQREFERAAALDPARAERLKKRATETASEAAARGVWLEARETLEKAETRIDELAAKLSSGDKKERDAAPKLVTDEEKQIGAWIQAARRLGDELERRFPGTLTRAILSESKDRPPEGARYAGVDVPPETPEEPPGAPIKTPVPPGGVPPAGAPGGAAPGMGGDAPGMDGAPSGSPTPSPGAGTPGMDAPGPVPPTGPPGMDAPPGVK